MNIDFTLFAQSEFSQMDVPNWDKFIYIVRFFGFHVRVTGGMVYTHEINCSPKDLVAIIELSK